VRWNNATVSSSAENDIIINAETDNAFRIVEQVGPRVHGTLTFTTGGPVSAARYRKIARALWKATLECAYLDVLPTDVGRFLGDRVQAETVFNIIEF
jgi:hypothetical protein